MSNTEEIVSEEGLSPSDDSKPEQQKRVLQWSNEIDRLRIDLSKARKQVVFLGVVVLALLALVFKMSGNQMVVVVPATATKPFWVSNKTASPESFEDIALYSIQLIKNFTPKNIAYKQKKFLELVDAGSYGIVQDYLLSEKDYVVKNNITQVFHPSSVKIDQANMTVQVTGDEDSWVNKDPLPTKRKTYLIRLGFNNGFISVRQVIDVDKEKKS